MPSSNRRSLAAPSGASRVLRPLAIACLAALLALPLEAQVSGPELSIGPGRLGDVLTIEVRAGVPSGAPLVVAWSDALVSGANGPELWLGSPVLRAHQFGFPAQGDFSWTLPLLPDPVLAAAPPRFIGAAVTDPAAAAGFALTPVRRAAFDLADSWRERPALMTARAFHQATQLGGDRFAADRRILVSGGGDGDFLAPGATASTELRDPLTDSVIAGPTMAVARVFHQAVRLADGRVLICGGADGGGVATASVEIFDPVSGQMTATGPMLEARVGHAATLLDDGRVLVTGGLATYQNALVNALAVFGSARDTAEIYDPVTGTWSATASVMTSPRSGHAQILMPDGRVLLTGGIAGSMNVIGFGIPTATATCEWFDPTSGTFSSAPAIAPARAFHRLTRLGSGELLLTGGAGNVALFGALGALDSCLRFDGTTWQLAGALPGAVAFHEAVTLDSGEVAIIGGAVGDASVGFTAVADCGVHDGVLYSARAPMTAGGVAIGLSGLAVAKGEGGRVLAIGGNDGMTTESDRILSWLP